VADLTIMINLVSLAANALTTFVGNVLTMIIKQEKDDQADLLVTFFIEKIDYRMAKMMQ